MNLVRLKLPNTNESYIRDPSTDLVLSLDTVRLPLGPLDSNDLGDDLGLMWRVGVGAAQQNGNLKRISVKGE